MLQALTLPRLRDLTIILGANIILALSAWISIPLPFTPVPLVFTMQLALFFGALLGKRGALAVLFYFLEGACGLPVFANGACGFPYLMGPTGGFLLGFVVSAYVLSILSEKIREKTELKTFLLVFFGSLIIYTFGFTHLASLIGMKKAFMLGIAPFIVPDLLKAIFFQRMFRKLAST